MVAMSSRRKTITTSDLIRELATILPGLTFIQDSAFLWSPQNHAIHYPDHGVDKPEGQARLIHEFGHAVLGHKAYDSDFRLLRMEVEAWEQAKLISQRLGIVLNQDFIEDCLDTYRDWVHRRSTCPRCTSVCFQKNVDLYTCHNCSNTWRVTSARFHRAYRIQEQYV